MRMDKKRKKKGQTGIVWITIMIGVIIGMVSMEIIGNQINTQTTTKTVEGDTFTASNTTCVEVTSNCLTSITTVFNYTQTFGSGNYTACSYDAPSGRYDGILFNGGTDIDNQVNGKTINSTYTEVSCQRVTGTTATLVGYLPLLFAVAILIFVVGYIAFKGS